MTFDLFIEVWWRYQFLRWSNHETDCTIWNGKVVVKLMSRWMWPLNHDGDMYSLLLTLSDWGLRLESKINQFCIWQVSNFGIGNKFLNPIYCDTSPAKTVEAHQGRNHESYDQNFLSLNCTLPNKQKQLTIIVFII